MTRPWIVFYKRLTNARPPGSRSGLLASRYVDNRPSAFSYTLYIIHYPLLLLSYSLLHPLTHGYDWPIAALAAAGAILPIIFVAAMLSRVVENRALLSRWLNGAILLAGINPSIIRRRSHDIPQESWRIFYGDVPVGWIGMRSGVPVGVDRWGWRCGFYPGMEPGQHRDGSASHVQIGAGGFSGNFLAALVGQRTLSMRMLTPVAGPAARWKQW